MNPSVYTLSIRFLSALLANMTLYTVRSEFLTADVRQYALFMRRLNSLSFNRYRSKGMTPNPTHETAYKVFNA